MKETNEPIAGIPPYERGYKPIGYLEQIPLLRLIDADEKLIVVKTTEAMLEALQLSHTEPIYIAAEVLLDEISKEEFISKFVPDERLRILVSCTSDTFGIIALLRNLRAISGRLAQNTQLRICCYIHSFGEYLYALIAQTDELIADESERHLISPENQLLLSNTLICNTIDPFY